MISTRLKKTTDSIEVKDSRGHGIRIKSNNIILSADLANNALDEFVHGEGNVGMDGKHFPQGVLVLGRLHVSIQKIAHHFQKHRVIVLHINIHCK